MRQWFKRVLCVTPAILLLAIGAWWLGLGERSQKPVYAFDLPATMLTCMVFELHDNDRFAHWHIKQPMTLVVRGNNIRIENSLIEGGCVFHPMVDLAANSDVRAGK